VPSPPTTVVVVPVGFEVEMVHRFVEGSCTTKYVSDEVAPGETVVVVLVWAKAEVLTESKATAIACFMSVIPPV
jgi:hypothetical protein